MFICSSCSLVSKPKEKPNKQPSKIRRVQYISKTQEVIGEGWEIESEVNLCDSCSGLTYLDLTKELSLQGVQYVQKQVADNSNYKRGYGGERHTEESYRDERRRRDSRRSLKESS